VGIIGGFGGSCELSYILLFFSLSPALYVDANPSLSSSLPGLLVDTPYHFEPVNFYDPFRLGIPPDFLLEYYKEDVCLRFILRGKIEQTILGTRGTPKVYRWLSELLWDHLYPIPESLGRVGEGAGGGIHAILGLSGGGLVFVSVVIVVIVAMVVLRVSVWLRGL